MRFIGEWVSQPARSPLAHALFLSMIYCTAPSFPASKFPVGNLSFNTSFSRLSSLTSRFSHAFSCSSSFSR
jgi:hypothetical protein